MNIVKKILMGISTLCLLISTNLNAHNDSIIHPKKVLFLGDSFTVGTGLEDGEKEKAFPYQLINKLKANHVLVGAPTIYAIDGDTTKHLLGALNVMLPSSNPDNASFAPSDYDLVVLSIGINDLFRGHTLADYKHHFEELLNRAIRFANDDPTKVMVLSIPAWDASPSVYNEEGPNFRYKKYEQVRNNTNEICLPIKDIVVLKNKATINLDTKTLEAKIKTAKAFNTQQGIANGIDSFNHAAMEISKSKKSQFIDLSPLTRIKPDVQKDYQAMFAKDGIHYSAKMYEKWTNVIYQSAYRILTDQGR